MSREKRINKLMPSNAELLKLAKKHPAPEEYWADKDNPFLPKGQITCTTCGGRMKVSSSDEGTNCYVSVAEEEANKYKETFVIQNAALETVRNAFRKNRLSGLRQASVAKSNEYCTLKVIWNSVNSDDAS